MISIDAAAVSACRHRCFTIRCAVSLVVLAIFFCSPPSWTTPQKPKKLPRSQRLDDALVLRRDAAGELRATARAAHPESPAASSGVVMRLRAQTNLVEVNCNVLRADGSQVRELGQEAFRVFEDGAQQRIAHFDAAREPASLVVLIDSSPSVLPDLVQMKRAARALAAQLSPVDEVAVAAFGGETRLLLPFTRDRAELEQVIDSVKLDLGPGSNIYRAIFLVSRELFPGRAGRKALLLVTDGQDSGLGLSWSPASALPQSGANRDRLSFEDVARALGEQGIELHVISTQPRPRAMTEAWLASHAIVSLIDDQAPASGMPHYTLYLAELVRRAGGRLYFLREIGSLADIYQRIAAQLTAQYTLGYYPAAGSSKPGWHSLSIAVVTAGQAGAPVATVRHRPAYYLPPIP